jgi:hypothetical protein
MLCQLTGKAQLASELHLLGGNSLTLSVAGETSSLRGDALKHIHAELIHDVHTLLGDTEILVLSAQNLVDVCGKGSGVCLVTSLSGLISGGRGSSGCLSGGLLSGSGSSSGLRLGHLCLNYGQLKRQLIFEAHFFQLRTTALKINFERVLKK